MNRNRKLRKQMMSGLAVGMAAVMGAAPVYAATGEDAAVSKEETVYAVSYTHLTLPTKA